MADDTTQLGSIITNSTARKIVYGIYVIILLAAGAAAVWFTSQGEPLPSWLAGATAVLAYLGIPIGSLALANATPGKTVTTQTLLTPAPADDVPATPGDIVEATPPAV